MHDTVFLGPASSGIRFDDWPDRAVASAVGLFEAAFSGTHRREPERAGKLFLREPDHNWYGVSPQALNHVRGFICGGYFASGIGNHLPGIFYCVLAEQARYDFDIEQNAKQNAK